MSTRPPAISVILSTYNRPKYLELTLEGFYRQSLLDFELIVADDGSESATARVVDQAQRRAPFPIHHVWQEDRGFRLARIRNLAIRRARGRCLIFNDDDCVPFRDLVRVFAAAHRPDAFTVNRVAYLDEALTARLDPGAIARGEHERLVPSAEWRRLRRARRNTALYIFCRVMRRRPVLVGNSFAVDRDSIVAINGFDQGYEGWGQEDDDLTRRLRLARFRPTSVIGSAMAVHQHHTHAQWHPPARREGTNVSYYERGFFLVRCLRGLEPREIGDLTFFLPPSRAGVIARLRATLEDRGRLLPRGRAEIEIQADGPRGWPVRWSAASQVRVLVRDRGDGRARWSRGQHLTIAVGRDDPGSEFLAKLSDALAPETYRRLRPTPAAGRPVGAGAEAPPSLS